MKTVEELQDILKRAQERYKANFDGEYSKFANDVLEAIESAIETTSKLAEAKTKMSTHTSELLMSLSDVQRANEAKLAAEARTKELEETLDNLHKIANEPW